MTPIPGRLMNICLKHGIIQDNSEQTLDNGLHILPKEYLTPMTDFYKGKSTITPNTYVIHHFAASWWSEEGFYHLGLSRKIAQKFHISGNISERIARFITYIKFHGVLYTLHRICRFAGKKLGLIHK